MKNLLLFLPLIAIISNATAQGIAVNYSEGAAKLTGYLHRPKGAGKQPGVVIIHAWMGIKDHERTTADRLAELGYYALAADIYGDGIAPKDRDEASAQAGKFRGGDRLNYRARIQAAIQELIKVGADPDRIAVIGYCFGGTGALEAARAGMPVKGVVSFHGGLGKGSLDTPPISAKVLVLHGAEDEGVNKEMEGFQDEMRAIKADWQMVYYADAVHGFTEPGSKAYNEKAAKRSWEHMRLFLKELFGQ